MDPAGIYEQEENADNDIRLNAKGGELTLGWSQTKVDVNSNNSDCSTIKDSKESNLSSLPLEGACSQAASSAVTNRDERDTSREDTGNQLIPNVASIVPTISSVSRINSFLSKSGRHKYYDEPETNYEENLHYRFRRAINADTSVKVGKKEFPCHLVLLQSYSRYFQRFKRPPETVYRLQLPEEIISEKHFPCLMNWILLEGPFKSRIITKDNVVPLYAAGHFLEIHDLMEQCWDFIIDAIQNNDPIILQMYEQAKAPKFKQLRNILSTKLAEMFDILYESGQFLSIGLEDFLLILNSDDVNIQSEEEIFHAASRWLLDNWEERSKYAVRLMKCVRFGLLTSLQLTQIRHCAEITEMADYAQIFSYPEIKDMLNDGLTYAIFRENYEANPEELNKWLEYSNVNQPRKRNCLKASPLKAPNPSVISGLQLAPSKPVVNSRSKCTACKSSVSTTTPSTSTPLLKSTSVATPAMKMFVDEADDPRPLLSNRKSVNHANTRQSSLHDPFTLASVLRMRSKPEAAGRGKSVNFKAKNESMQ